MSHIAVVSWAADKCRSLLGCCHPNRLVVVVVRWVASHRRSVVDFRTVGAWLSKSGGGGGGGDGDGFNKLIGHSVDIRCSTSSKVSVDVVGTYSIVEVSLS